MRTEKLSSLLDISIGRTPARKESKYWGKGHKWVSIRDLSAKTICVTKEEITDIAVKEARCKIVPEGTLLFSFKLTIGKMAFAGCDLFTNEAIAAFAIKDKKQLFSEYLYYALKTAKLDGSNQAAMGKTLNSKSLAEIRIPLPPFNDQVRIAHLLGKVEGLITQRKQNLQQLDDLLKSVFLEMFGDPVRNEMEWEHQPCTRVVTDIQSGISYGGEEKPILEDDEYGVLKISAVTQGRFDSSEFKAVKIAIIKKSLRFVKNGDFLFSRANTIELVAACCIVDNDYPTLFIPDKLWLLSFSESINPQYFNFLLKNESFRNLVRKKASGGHDSMLNISMKKFHSLRIPVPPTDLQNQFATIVGKVEGIKNQYQQSLTELENLYGTLSQKAFKGELDLSRIPLLPEAEATDTLAIQIEDEIDQDQVFTLHNEFHEYPLSNSKARGEVLLNSFDTFLKSAKKGEPLSLDAFWKKLSWEAVDYAQEGDLPFRSEDYDLVKGRLFDAIKSGDIEQTRNDIEIDGKSDLGNQVILQKAN